MKKIVLLSILAFVVFISGCEKCECDPDEYYIKYAVAVQTIYMGVALDIVMINEYNETTPISTTGSWNMTIGPVEKGFNASLSAVTERELGNTTLVAKIYVSKNDGPFAEKASGENDTSEPLQIDYTIDF